jgi:hypothetical protein
LWHFLKLNIALSGLTRFMDIKRTPLAIVLAATMATGCSASNRDDTRSEYCRNGGSTTDYTCEPGQQSPDREMIDAKSLPSTDEAWMQSKLAEIKTWLQQEKNGQATPLNSAQKPATDRIIVRDPSATDPELMRIETMSRNGDHRAAMSAINSFLTSHPKSLEGVLTKSLVLNNMGEVKEAEMLLKRAIKEHPSSPEVYNNLAVLYAEQGDNGQAIETLLQAFSTHPTYAQVHQNLRELYATVASQAYSRALDLNQKPNSPQLVMLRRTADVDVPALAYQPAQISSSNNSNQTIAAVTPPAPTSKPEPKAAPKPEAKAPEPKAPEVKVSEPVKAPQPAKVEPKPEPKPTVVAEVKKPEPVKPAVAPKPTVEVKDLSVKPEAAKPTAPELVREAVAHVNQWAEHWRNQNVNGYVNSYTANYRPGGLSHSAWVAQRKQRLSSPTFIKVTLANVKTTLVNDNTAKVVFSQGYQSNTYQDQTRKELTLTRVNGQWRISDERSL